MKTTTYPIKDKSKLNEFKNYYLKNDNKRNYLLIVTGLNTALRISDILNLKWNNVYDNELHKYREHIIITESKTKKLNTIAINNSLKKAMKLYHRHQSPDSYIFCRSNNPFVHISRSQAWRIIKEAANKTGLGNEHISCHSLRKTFGYCAWQQGVQPAMLMNIYNHSSYKITKRYLGIEQDDKDNVFKNITL